MMELFDRRPSTAGDVADELEKLAALLDVMARAAENRWVADRLQGVQRNIINEAALMRWAKNRL